MYGKLFASLYQGTLRGNAHAILVFTNLIAHADRDGFVDKHWRAIAEETGLTVDETRAAIAYLESPDAESRSQDEEGRRIVRIDSHRAWGWRIVNHPKYNGMRNEADRREQNRRAQEKWRKLHKPSSASVSQDKPLSAHIDVDVDVDSSPSPAPPPACGRDIAGDTATTAAMEAQLRKKPLRWDRHRVRQAIQAGTIMAVGAAFGVGYLDEFDRDASASGRPLGVIAAILAWRADEGHPVRAPSGWRAAVAAWEGLAGEQRAEIGAWFMGEIKP